MPDAQKPLKSAKDRHEAILREFDPTAITISAREIAMCAELAALRERVAELEAALDDAYWIINDAVGLDWLRSEAENAEHETLRDVAGRVLRALRGEGK